MINMYKDHILKGKVILVTGGARGIGAAICKKAAERGADIAIHYNTSYDQANELKNKLIEWGSRCIIIQGDITKEEDIRGILEQVINEFGTIDILVNNAAQSFNALMLRVKVDDWERILNTNLKSVFLFSKMFARYCIKKRKVGSVINISSCASTKGNVGMGVYGVSKSGVNSLTKTLAKECAQYNIRFNAVAPGPVDTEMMANVPADLIPNIINEVPMKRVGTPEEIAEMVTFLGSDLSSFITGAIIAVDGGLTA